MIRVVVVDDHPALRAGLRTVLDSEPGIIFVGDSDGGEQGLWPMLRTTQPDLVLMDYHLTHGDGLQLCYRIKQQQVPVPAVVIFSAYASTELALPAMLAGADAVLSKGVGARELFEAIRRVNRGERLVESPSATTMREASERIPESDRALVGMLLDGTTEQEAANTLRIETREVRHAVQRTLSTLRLDVPTARIG